MIFTGIFIFSLFLSGCTNNPPGTKEKVVARINRFELTVEDFKEEANPLLMKKYSTYPLTKQKDQLLEELITKEVLLQEAQRLNFDKQKAFMKEIEGYWEQALMKSLINRKLQEFSPLVRVNNQDILEGYARLKLRISAQLFVFNDKLNAEKMSKAVWESPVDWYVSNELPQKLEDVLFSLQAGQLSEPIEYNGSWVVIRALNQEPQQIGTLEELTPRITENIIRRKKEVLLGNWISELRKKANVKIYRQTLNAVDLK